MKKFSVNLNEFKEAVEAIWLRGKYKSSTVSKVDVISNSAVAVVKNNTIQLANANERMAVIVNIRASAEDVDDFMFIFDIEKAMKYIKNMKMEHLYFEVDDANVKLKGDKTRVKLPVLVEHPNMSSITMILTLKIPAEGMPTIGKTHIKTKVVLQGKELAKAIRFCNLVGTATFTINLVDKEELKISSSNFHNTELVSMKVPIVASEGEAATVEFSAPIDRFCLDELMFLYLGDNKPIVLVGPDRKLIVAPYIRVR
tara:strand:- start:401 stop:1168 length:768 start_codon:yes stop_codon:yes gene_type:complete